MEEPLIWPSSFVSTRCPPLAPKKESGCKRLSRKELSICALVCLPRRFHQKAKPPIKANKAAPAAAKGAGSSSNSSRALGGSTGAAAGGVCGFTGGVATAGAGTAGVAGAAASGEAGAAAGALGAAGVAATGAAGAGAAGAATGAGAGVAAAALAAFRSAMFLASSAARSLASLSARSLAILASSALLVTDPLERVSLSGLVLAGFLSSTLACTVPLALRSAAATGATGVLLAMLRRRALKSLLWATNTLVASAAESALACSAEGTSSTAPLRSRFTSSLTNAAGLARSMATSIWSRETSADLVRWAILLAVSPSLTVTLSPATDAGFPCIALPSDLAGFAIASGALALPGLAAVAGAGGGSDVEAGVVVVA